MNSVHLIGRLATDVEVKEVNGGSKVSSFILAVDRNAEEAGVALPAHRVVTRMRCRRCVGRPSASAKARMGVFAA